MTQKNIHDARYIYLQSGLSLVEMLLAYALGLCLLTSLVQVYLIARRNNDMQQVIIAMQENGRFAVNYLQQSIRLAGYNGCNLPPFVNQASAIQGYENNLPDFLKSKVILNTDSIVIGSCIVRNGKELFQSQAFFISATNRKNALGKPTYALYEAVAAEDKQELVANIENMKIYYGVNDKDFKNIAYYTTATAVKNWLKVRIVSLHFLQSSDRPVFTKPNGYYFDGKNMPPDRFLHKEWVIDIALRER